MGTDVDSLTRKWLKNSLRSEMVKRGLSYADLTKLLLKYKIDSDEHVIRNKVARGTFSASFFVQCLAAIGCKTLNIDVLEHREDVPKGTRRP